MKRKITGTDLLKALEEGGPEKEKAIRKFFFTDTSLQNQVRRFVVNHNGTAQDAEEVYDDAVVFFIQNTAKNNLLNPESVIPYFLKIAKNQWFNRYRKRNSTSPLTHHQFEISEAEIMEDEEWPEEFKEMLDYGLAHLDERQRKMLQAKYEEDLSMQKIADSFNISEDMAKKSLYRFRGYLLEHMKKHRFFSMVDTKKMKPWTRKKKSGTDG